MTTLQGMSNAPKSKRPSLAKSVLQLLSRIPVQEVLKFNLNLELSSGWIVFIVILVLVIGIIL